ncbi:transposase [Paraphaeosphaeria sporulosa]
MGDLGQPLRMKHMRSLAFRATRHRPPESRPSKPLGKNWPKAFEQRYPDLKARREKGLEWNRHRDNIHEKVTHWFEVIGKVLEDPRIQPEYVHNMDETGIMLPQPDSVKVLVECISADGRYLTLMIIWPATTHRSNWTTFETPGWQYACTESGYANSKINLEWLKRIYDPQTKDRANGKPRVLICDGFGSHESLDMLEFCFENNIILCRLPSHTAHKIQPCDVAAFGPLKAAYREQVDRLERGGVNAIGKEHFTSLYSAARVKAFTPRNIKAGFAASGGLDEASRLRLEKRIQKFVNAVQTCLSKGALQQDYIRFLLKINDESKTRRSTKSNILAKGEGMVVSYEHLVAKREALAAKREALAAKAQAKASGTGKRGRKRTRSAEAEKDVEPSVKMARTSEARLEEAGSWRAPVAVMY